MSGTSKFANANLAGMVNMRARNGNLIPAAQTASLLGRANPGVSTGPPTFFTMGNPTVTQPPAPIPAPAPPAQQHQQQQQHQHQHQNQFFAVPPAPSPPPAPRGITNEQLREHLRSQKNCPSNHFRFPPLPFTNTAPPPPPSQDLVRPAAEALARTELASVEGWYEFLGKMTQPRVAFNDTFKMALFEWLVQREDLSVKEAQGFMRRGN